MSKCRVVGELNKAELYILEKKRPEFARTITETKVFMWEDRLSHIEKHRPNYKQTADLDRYISQIQEIIEEPDYLGVRDSDNSLQFIKHLEDNVPIAVRLTVKGKLYLRTMYPVTDSQINDYLRKGTAWVLR